MIGTVAWRELRTLFLSPLAWIVFVVVLLLLAFLFTVQLLDYAQRVMPMAGMVDDLPGMTEYIVPQVLWLAGMVTLIVVPLLTMRLFAEERHNKTLVLLLSAPVSMTEIVLGKFLGVFGFLLVVIAVASLIPLSLALGGHVDLGLLASGIIGWMLLTAGCCAIGLYFSLLTRYAAVSAIGSFGLLLLLWLLDASGRGVSEGNPLATLSLSTHYLPFLQGLFDSMDALYYVLLTTMFLVLSVRRLDAERMGL